LRREGKESSGEFALGERAEVHHHRDIPLRRWVIRSKKGCFGEGWQNLFAGVIPI
jgi:hypothetical protein